MAEVLGRYGAVANVDLGALVTSINQDGNMRIINILQTAVATSRLTDPVMMFVAVVEHLNYVPAMTTPTRCHFLLGNGDGMNKRCIKDEGHEGGCE